MLRAHTAQGQDAASFASSSSAPPAAPSAPTPPPPPPPPAPVASTSDTSATPRAGGMSSVFSALNVGSGVTTGLRKVTADQQTHKNPALRAEAGPAPLARSTSGGASAAPSKPPKPAAMQKKPPRLELSGTKWLVEHQVDVGSPLVIDRAEIGHTVEIYACKNAVVQIKGKVNAVNMVNCTKTSVLLDSVVSSIAVTSSPSFAVQITGLAPSLTVDATDGGMIYLSKACLAANVEIITAKTSAINVSLPEEGEEDGVFRERGVPEQVRRRMLGRADLAQIKTVVQGGKLVSSVVEHAG